MGQIRSYALHYWLIANRGGERVFAEIVRLVQPQRCYTHLADDRIVAALQLPCPLVESAYASMPLARRAYKLLFPLMYLAAWLLPLKDADLIVSSESGPIKGIRKRKNALHICYCHSPLRILWAPAEWYRPVLGAFSTVLPLLRWPLRLVDRLAARPVDVFIANSTFIQQRIREAYARDSVVIHPPVELGRFKPSALRENHFIWLGELVSYKRPDLVIEAFRRNGLPLKVVGSGELLERLRRNSPPNVEFLPQVSDDELPTLLARARALVFCGVEDFGLVFVEALAAGTPVIAYGQGGVVDIVEHGVTGVLFGQQSAVGLNAALEAFTAIELQFDPARLAQAAQRFRPEVFREKFLQLLQSELHKRGLSHG